jgi:hypothetical protein
LSAQTQCWRTRQPKQGCWSWEIKEIFRMDRVVQTSEELSSVYHFGSGWIPSWDTSSATLTHPTMN